MLTNHVKQYYTIDNYTSNISQKNPSDYLKDFDDNNYLIITAVLLQLIS